MKNDFQPGDYVKINPCVYEYKWPEWEEIAKKFGHENLIVERIIDLTDVGMGKMAVVAGRYNKLGVKALIKQSYLWETP